MAALLIALAQNPYGGDLNKTNFHGQGSVNARTDVAAEAFCRMTRDLAACARTAPFLHTDGRSRPRVVVALCFIYQSDDRRSIGSLQWRLPACGLSTCHDEWDGRCHHHLGDELR